MNRAQIEIVGGEGEITTSPPDPIRVGGGTAFYVGGTMTPGVASGARVRAGELEFAIDAHSMPAERRYDRGELWWTMVTIPGDAAIAGEDPPLPEPLAGDRTAPIAICMATHEPEPDRLRVQLDSIRGQTRDDWICVISDDCSSPRALDELERQIAGDPRFVLSRSDERLGFLRNFERAISMAPATAELIALADQDDRWHPDKLEVLAAALAAGPASLLAYSDVRIADAAGNVLADTYFFERRNNAASMASMLITNNVTGAASMFRRELLATALPFPPGGTGQELYHDHWLALCAMATAPLAFVNRPTHDYVRHDESVTVTEAEGHVVLPPEGRLGGLRMRAARAARRLRLASRSPGWRTAYVGRYMLIRQLAAILELRIGRERILPGHRADIDRLLAAEHSPRAAAWLLARSFRPWIGRNDTLARERAVFGGILWRKLAGRR
ncbi:MAG TPA: glycosyltransferase [Solirubrobacterales bacterium]|nr:glycosyltransferase [Solirubrobacterales bacterium]